MSLRKAAEAFLKRIDNITSERFSVGEDAPEREALRAALAEPEAGGEWPTWPDAISAPTGFTVYRGVKRVHLGLDRDQYARARAAVNAMPKVRALVEAADDFVKAMEAMSLSGKEKIKLVSALAALKAKL